MSAAVLGHMFPITRHFRGGKGVATMAGAMVVLHPLTSLVLTAVWFVTRTTTDKASLASLAITFGLPICLAVSGVPAWEFVSVIALCLLVLVRHIDNIKRLIARRELSANHSEPTDRQTGSRRVRPVGVDLHVAVGHWPAILDAVPRHRLAADTRRDVLRADPIGSVWHLHIQPPLWNLLIGGVLAWSPMPDAISLQIVQFAFGVVGVALLASLLARLFARPVVGVVVATVVMLDPQVLAGAFTPTYELATTCGLIAVMWLVVVQPRSPRFTLVSLSAVGTAVVLTRTVFHPAWLALLLLVSWWTVRRSIDARTIVWTVAMPLVLVGGWMVKNEVMFDRPTLSSWFGMNLQRAVLPIATDDQLDSWAADGDISEITAAYPSGFVSYSAYEPYVGECIPKGDHAATTDLTRVGPLAIPNFNADCYLPVYDIADDDATWAITNHPSLYLEGRWWALRAWVMEAPPPLLPTSPIYDALCDPCTGSPSSGCRCRFHRSASATCPGVRSTCRHTCRCSRRWQRCW